MQLELTALRDWPRIALAAYKYPRFVEFLDELPKNATGKVLKDQLLNS